MSQSDSFYAKVKRNSVWHSLTAEQRKEVARIQLNSFKMSAEYADDEATERAVEHLRRVFW